jgi:hypothetical protein
MEAGEPIGLAPSALSESLPETAVVTTMSEYEQARTAISVACLRWLRSELEAVNPLPQHEPLVRDSSFRLVDLPVGTVLQDREHPLWDVWLDG